MLLLDTVPGCDGLGEDINNTGDQLFFSRGPCGDSSAAGILNQANQSSQLDPALEELTNSRPNDSGSEENSGTRKRRRKNGRNSEMPELIEEGGRGCGTKESA